MGEISQGWFWRSGSAVGSSPSVPTAVEAITLTEQQASLTEADLGRRRLSSPTCSAEASRSPRLSPAHRRGLANLSTALLGLGAFYILLGAPVRGHSAQPLGETMGKGGPR